MQSKTMLFAGGLKIYPVFHDPASYSVQKKDLGTFTNCLKLWQSDISHE